MDEEQFTLDLEQSQLCGDIDALQYWSVDDLVSLYTDTLTDLIDRHCPVSSVRKKIVKLSPWFYSECQQQRKETRKLEKAYRKSHFPSDHLAWTVSLKCLHRLYETKSKEFWCTKTAESRGDSRKLWHTVSALMGDTGYDMPADAPHSAEDFAKYFLQKIDSIRSETASASQPAIPFMDVEHLLAVLPL